MGNGIIKCNDHLPIFQVTHLKLDAEPPCQKRLTRLINSATLAAFRSRLETANWSLIYNSDSTLMIPMTHSLGFLFQHIVSHFHLTVDLHHSKPLISLVPFNLHFHCFQG